MTDVWIINQRINKLVPIAKKQIDDGDFRNAQETTEIIQRLTQWRREIMIQRNQKKMVEHFEILRESFKKFNGIMMPTSKILNDISNEISEFKNFNNQIKRINGGSN